MVIRVCSLQGTERTRHWYAQNYRAGVQPTKSSPVLLQVGDGDQGQILTPNLFTALPRAPRLRILSYKEQINTGCPNNKSSYIRGLLYLLAIQETWVRSLGQEDALENSMATHPSILAWRIPWKRSLVGYSPCGGKELGTTEQLTHFIS